MRPIAFQGAPCRRLIPVLPSLILACLGGPSLAAQEKQPAAKANEAEWAELLSKQVEAWNSGDLESFMETYWKSEQLTFSAGGNTTRGWQATLDRYRRRYPDRQAMGTLRFDRLEWTRLGPDAALGLGQWFLQREGGAMQGNFTLVLKRIDGQWRIIHDHSSIRPEE